MKILDPIGNELQTSDAVIIDLPQVIGVIQKVDTGEIARGIVLDGGKPAGQQMPPHIIVKVELTVPILIQTLPGSPVGQVPGVLKVAKPVQKADNAS